MMRTSLIFAAGVALCVLATASHARLYKWVDDSGTVHYSDRLPPEQTNKKYEELTSSGIKAKEVKRQKTQEELRAELASRQAEQKQEEIARRKQAEQERKDQILLDTFTTERDILLMRDDRLDAIDANIKITTSYNEQITEQIADTRMQIDRLEKGKREIPENITKKLENLIGQLEKNTKFIEDKTLERDRVTEQFAADLARFKLLTQGEPEESEDSAESEEDKRFSETLLEELETN